LRAERRISVLAVAVAAVTAATAVAGVEASSRIVDRTFVCSPIAYGGVGDLDIWANPSRDDGLRRHFVATLEVRTGASMPGSSLVLVRARSQPKHPGLAYEWPVDGRAGVFAHSRRCVPAPASVPLSPKGLAGPPIRWNKELDCPLRGRVLVRVRAVLTAPDDWRRADRWYAGSRKPVVEAKLAVRSQVKGTPLSYMELDSRGRTALWYSPACG